MQIIKMKRDNMRRTVIKFGGSSVSTIEKMQLLADKIILRTANLEQLVVVVSAMGKTTSELLTLSKRVSLNPDKREVDLLISTGEQYSIALFTMILIEKGCPAISLTGPQAGIITTGLHTQSKIVDIDISIVEKHLENNKVVVVAGFQGINNEGDITTLGRGGSNTTAASLAAKLKCPCETYTDVEGIYKVDPNLYPQAKKFDVIGYEEMKEMAFLGAKVMEPRSIEIAERYRVPLYVASAHKNRIGTYIREKESIEKKSITGLAINDKIIIVTLNNVLNDLSVISDIFIQLANNEINIDIISQNIVDDKTICLAFAACTDDLHIISLVIDKLIKQYPDIKVKKDLDIVKLSVVGIGMRTQTEVAIKLYKLLADNNISYKLVTISEISISISIDSNDKLKAVQVISEALNL